MRIARELKGLHAMRFQIVASPDVVHRRLANSHVLGQGAATPLRSPSGFGPQSRIDDLLDFLRAVAGFAPPAGSNLPHTRQTLLGKAGAPEHHRFAIDR